MNPLLHAGDTKHRRTQNAQVNTAGGRAPGRVTRGDVLQGMGLVLLGSGLFVLWGPGAALAVVGVLLVVMGFFGG
jgi:hypothetical protein